MSKINNLPDDIRKALAETKHFERVAFLKWVFGPVENCEICGGTEDSICVCPSCDFCGEAPHDGECD